MTSWVEQKQQRKYKLFCLFIPLCRTPPNVDVDVYPNGSALITLFQKLARILKKKIMKFRLKHINYNYQENKENRN